MAERLYLMFTSVLRTVSLAACLIVIASFLLFAVDQIGAASTQQTASLTNTVVVPTKPAPLTRALTNVDSHLTSPFRDFAGSSNSEWMVRSIEATLALVVYGFGVGYLVRVMRVRE